MFERNHATMSVFDVVPAYQRALLLKLHEITTVQLANGATPAQVLARIGYVAPGLMARLSPAVFSDIERLAEFLSIEPSGTVH